MRSEWIRVPVVSTLDPRHKLVRFLVDTFDYRGNWTSSSSGGQTTSASKHIHFNDRVEQCITVDVKDDESEDEGIFMPPRHPRKVEHSTIAKLHPPSCI